MRELLSKDTGKAPTIELNSDVEVFADGEGGIILSVCWHELKELGSVAVHLPRSRVNELLKTIAVIYKETDR